MKLLFTSILVAISATSASAGGLRQGRNLNQVFPPYSQQCRDDAGPPFRDDAETFSGKKYHEGKPATAVGNCPNPVKGACRQKSKTAAFLEGPIDCGDKGWFCRILEEPGWPALALTSDVNFGYCNTTQGFEDPGWDRSGHCHGSDSDDTFYWWVRDHWFRGYNGRLRCCCGWEDQVKAGKVVNRCDHRRLVTRDEDLSKCRDANEQDVSPYNGGCATNGDSPTIGEPIPENDAMCWEVSKFGEPDDGDGGGSNDEDEDDNEDSGDGSGSNDEDDNGSCGEDDGSFLFKGRRNKGCDWVGQTKKRAERLCPKTSEGKKVSESCPVTCGTCSNDEEDEDDCGEDDSSFLFKDRRNKGCDWVGKVTKRAERLCPMMSKGKKVSESCPVACQTCSNDEEDEEEEEGSGSEDQDEEEGSGSGDQDEEEGSGSGDQDEEEGSGSGDQDEEEGSGSGDQDEEEGSGSEDQEEEEGSGSGDQDEEEGSGSEDQDEEEGSGSEDQDEEEGSSNQEEEEDRL